MVGNRSITDRFREVLRTYAAKWSAQPGDIVIQEREIFHVVDKTVQAVDSSIEGREVSDADLFDVLMETHRAGSVQSQMDALSPLHDPVSLTGCL